MIHYYEITNIYSYNVYINVFVVCITLELIFGILIWTSKVMVEEEQLWDINNKRKRHFSHLNTIKAKLYRPATADKINLKVIPY